MPSGGFKPFLTVAFLTAICLVKLTVCKSIDDGFEIETLDEVIESKLAKGKENLDQGERNSKPISDDEFVIGPLDETMESEPAQREKPNETQKHSKRILDNEFRKEPVDEALKSKSPARTENSSEGQKHLKRGSKSRQNILNKCFSGGFNETLTALGVLDLPGVRLVHVEGELYQTLLKKQKVVKSKSEVNASAAKIPRDQSIAKRSSIDMCEEELAYTYILYHANGQIAYQVDTVVCQGSFCQSPHIKSLLQGEEFGDCVLEEKSMLVYVMDNYGNFAPQTINIGCACKCMAYF